MGVCGEFAEALQTARASRRPRYRLMVSGPNGDGPIEALFYPGPMSWSDVTAAYQQGMYEHALSTSLGCTFWPLTYSVVQA